MNIGHYSASFDEYVYLFFASRCGALRVSSKFNDDDLTLTQVLLL